MSGCARRGSSTMLSSMSRATLVVLALVGCSSPDRAPTVTGEHPAGMQAPATVSGIGGSSAGTSGSEVVRGGTIRVIPSLMRPPILGDPAPSNVTVSVNGVTIPVLDGRFAVDRAGWFAITDGAVRMLANVAPSLGELTLPLAAANARGVPRDGKATVVLQLVDARGNPIAGAVGRDEPGVIGPCYDKSSDEMNDKLPSTGTRGTIAYLQIDPLAGATFRTELVVNARPLVVQVPIVGGTVTFLQTSGE